MTVSSRGTETLDRSTSVAVANAPCSYGAFEITVGLDPNVPDALTVLDEVTTAGYSGIDLGPLGYLGLGDELVQRLEERRLTLAGGYLELPFSEPERFAEELPTLDALLDVFDAAPKQDGTFAPKPTLADAGSPQRAALPGRSARDRSVGLDDAAWLRFADSLERAIERCRERGYEPTFHHHTATYVEAVWEIEKVLELTTIGLCFDTGHLLLGGGDPVGCLREWRDRVNHFHLKDARLDVLQSIVDDVLPVEEIWRRRAFCPFGEGDVDIDGVLSLLREQGYTGWIVVEQDAIPDPSHPTAQVAQEQRANREFLRARGL